jgi:hypothetical protein
MWRRRTGETRREQHKSKNPCHRVRVEKRDRRSARVLSILLVAASMKMRLPAIQRPAEQPLAARSLRHSAGHNVDRQRSEKFHRSMSVNQGSITRRCARTHAEGHDTKPRMTEANPMAGRYWPAGRRRRASCRWRPEQGDKDRRDMASSVTCANDDQPSTASRARS